jgi:hypothetical protein
MLISCNFDFLLLVVKNLDNLSDATPQSPRRKVKSLNSTQRPSLRDTFSVPVNFESGRRQRVFVDHNSSFERRLERRSTIPINNAHIEQQPDWWFFYTLIGFSSGIGRTFAVRSADLQCQQ